MTINATLSPEWDFNVEPGNQVQVKLLQLQEIFDGTQPTRVNLQGNGPMFNQIAFPSIFLVISKYVE